MIPSTGSAARTERRQQLRLTTEGDVVGVTLTRPEKLNALTFCVHADLRAISSPSSPVNAPCAPSSWR